MVVGTHEAADGGDDQDETTHRHLPNKQNYTVLTYHPDCEMTDF